MKNYGIKIITTKCCNCGGEIISVLNVKVKIPKDNKKYNILESTCREVVYCSKCGKKFDNDMFSKDVF